MQEPASRPAPERPLAVLARLAVVIAVIAGTTLFAVLAGELIVSADRGDRAAVRLPVAGGAPPTTLPASPGATTSPRPDPSPTPTAPPASPVPTASPTTEPSATPTATPEPRILAAPYLVGGRTYAGLEVQVDTALAARFDGSVEVRIYQLIGGSIRIGSNVPSLPFFPYITVVSADRRMIYRPGALGVDTELLVRDGQRIAVGEPLFRQIGPGRSSWATFYDAGSPFQVVVSLQALPSGRDLDPRDSFADWSRTPRPIDRSPSFSGRTLDRRARDVADQPHRWVVRIAIAEVDGDGPPARQGSESRRRVRGLIA